MDIPVNHTSTIVFDLDDTLYNEIDYLRSAYIEIAKKANPKNWKPLFSKMFSQYRSGMDVFAYIQEEYGIPKKVLISLYRQHTPVINPFKGVHETFQKINGHKGTLCIITDGRAMTQQKKLKALGLLTYIDKIVISEETGFEKPEENNYRIIEESFPNQNYWYIADNMRKDFIAPNRRGWQTVGLIDRGLNIHHEGHLHFDEQKSPKHFVLSIEEINIL